MLHSPRLIGCCLAVVILVFCFRSYRTHRVFNDTADEAVHIASGLEFWQTGRYTIEAQHPPLGRVALALPAYLSGLRQRNGRPLWTGGDPDFYWRTLSRARLGNLIFAPFLLVCVYLWGRRLYGPAAGLGAAALVSLSPNLLAHASLATLDFGAGTTLFISAYCFWRWSQEPGLRNCLLAAVAFGIAVITKFSALFLGPPLAIGFFAVSRWSARPWRSPGRWCRGAKRGALFLAVTALVVWSGYLFEIGPLPAAQFVPPAYSFGESLERAIQATGLSRSLPAPRFWRGVLDVLAHNAQGHQTYLLGRLGQFGWWYYFPVALAVKTTLPLLALVAMSLGLWLAAGGRGEVRLAVYPLLAAALLLAVCMGSNINLGIRHILVIYPLLALAASGLFAGVGVHRPAGRRVLTGVAIALTIWQAAESLMARPDYLAYFNQIVRGREDEYLLDSNLDWGQDLERLRRYLLENNVSTVYLSYFGRADPAQVGICGVRPLPPDLRPTGWVAVSKAHIAGLALKGYNLAWLKPYTPTAHIGKSILVYYFP